MSTKSRPGLFFIIHSNYIEQLLCRMLAILSNLWFPSFSVYLHGVSDCTQGIVHPKHMLYHLAMLSAPL